MAHIGLGFFLAVLVFTLGSILIQKGVRVGVVFRPISVFTAAINALNRILGLLLIVF